jgi:hypothetical protein
MNDLDENSSTDMAQITGHLRNLTRAGATDISIHHAAKNPAKPGYRGSTELGAGVDVIINIEKNESNNEAHLHFRVQKTRYAEDPRLALKVERTDTRPVFTREDPLPTKERQATRNELEELRTLLVHLEARDSLPNQSQITTAAYEAGLGSRNTILKWLEQGEATFWVSHPDGRSRVYQLLSTCPSDQSLDPSNELDKARTVQSTWEDKEIEQLDMTSDDDGPTLSEKKSKRGTYVG